MCVCGLPPSLTGAIAVNSVFAEHVQLAVLGDDAAAAVVAGGVDGSLALQLQHLLRLVRLWLSATFGCRGGSEGWGLHSGG